MARKRNLAGRGATLGCALLVLSLFGAGCLQSDRGGDNPVALAANAAAGDTWTGAPGAGPPRIPSAGELRAALALDDEQAAVVEEAIADLARRHAARREGRSERRAERGSRGERGAGPRGLGPDGEPPMLAFLEKVVPVLDAEQVEKLADAIASERDAWSPRRERSPRDGRGGRMGDERPRRHDGRRGQDGPHRPDGAGRGGPGLFLGGTLQDLDLTAEQRAEVRNVMEERAPRFHELRRRLRDGTATPEQLRDEGKELRESVEERVESILSEEQMASVREQLAEHRAAVAERRLERLEERGARHGAFLKTVLQLSDAQAAQVDGMLASTLAERRALLEGLAAGTVELEDALVQGHEIAEQAAESIRGVLTDEQVAVFDSLKQLLPGHRGPNGP